MHRSAGELASAAQVKSAQEFNKKIQDQQNAAPAAGAPNALGGHPYILLRDDFATVVAKSGAAMAPGVGPVKTMGIACGNRTPDCQKIIAGVQADSASAVVADATGKGVFPGVPAGTYYLMISAVYNNQPLLWAFRVDLKAGPNAVTLDQRNTSPVN